MEQLCILSSMAQDGMLQTSLSVTFNTPLLYNQMKASNEDKTSNLAGFLNRLLSGQICSTCMIVCNLFSQMAGEDSNLVEIVVLLLLNMFHNVSGRCTGS